MAKLCKQLVECENLLDIAWVALLQIFSVDKRLTRCMNHLYWANPHCLFVLQVLPSKIIKWVCWEVDVDSSWNVFSSTAEVSGHNRLVPSAQLWFISNINYLIWLIIHDELVFQPKSCWPVYKWGVVIDQISCWLSACHSCRTEVSYFSSCQILN